MNYLKKAACQKTNIKLIFMKYIKLIHSFLGILPFVWFVSFLLILSIGFIHFGAMPKYGNLVDPYALNLRYLSLFSFFCGFLAYLAFYLWLGMSIIFIVFFKKKYTFNKTTSILFFIGVFGFFLFKYLFTDAFAWVID